MSRPTLFAAASFTLVVACATAPSMRSPLRERLATADTSTVEDATRSCFNETGWVADPIGSVSGGSNVVSASNSAKNQTQVFIHPPDQKPRITGGPDDEKFWKCLGSKLGAGGGGDESSGDAGAPSDKSGGDKGDKPSSQDPGDKGGNGS